MSDGALGKLKSTIEHGRYIDISIMKDVFQHLKKYDDPSRRKKHNYVKKISREKNICEDSVVKTINILEEMDLVEKVSNGRKNTIKLKVVEKS